jgi:SAM-dependent methyltransferase
MIHRDDYIINRCKGKTVLHVGATDSPYTFEKINADKWLHSKIKKVAKKVIGIDIDIRIIDELYAIFKIDDICYGDIIKNKYDDEVLKYKYDVIILGDVIEHITEPVKALNNLYKLLKNNGQIIVTTENVWSIFHLNNHFKRNENVHPDHVCWYSGDTLGRTINVSKFNLCSSVYALRGSSKDKKSFKGKLFEKFVLDRYNFMGPVIIFTGRKNV